VIKSARRISAVDPSKGVAAELPTAGGHCVNLALTSNLRDINRLIVDGDQLLGN
jgi:hypothetical protein